MFPVRMIGVLMVYASGFIAGWQVGIDGVIWYLTLLGMFLALSGGFLSQARGTR